MQAMVPYHQSFLEDAVEAVRKGYVPVSRLDLAVTRVLALKQRLGYIPQHCTDHTAALDRTLTEAPAPRSTPIRKLADVPEDVKAQERVQSLQAARDGIVLLKNTGRVLPLDVAAGDVVAVVGPNAQSAANLLGAWSYHWQGATDETEVCASMHKCVCVCVRRRGILAAADTTAAWRAVQVLFEDVATAVSTWMAGRGGVAVAATGVTTDGQPVLDRCLTVAAVATKAIMCASSSVLCTASSTLVVVAAVCTGMAANNCKRADLCMGKDYMQKFLATYRRHICPPSRRSWRWMCGPLRTHEGCRLLGFMSAVATGYWHSLKCCLMRTWQHSSRARLEGLPSVTPSVGSTARVHVCR